MTIEHVEAVARSLANNSYPRSWALHTPVGTGGSSPLVLEVVLYVISIGWLASVVALAAKSMIYSLAAEEPPPVMVTAVLFCKTSQAVSPTAYNKMDVADGITRKA